MKKERLKKSLLAFFVVLLLFSLVACSDEDDDSLSSSKEQKTKFSKKKQKTEFSQDEAAVFKDVRYSITGIEKSQSTEYDSPEAGKEFIIISLKIENNSDKKISYNEWDWKMENSNGQEERNKLRMLLAANNLFNKEYKEYTNCSRYCKYLPAFL